MRCLHIKTEEDIQNVLRSCTNKIIYKKHVRIIHYTDSTLKEDTNLCRSTISFSNLNDYLYFTNNSNLKK